MGEGKNLHEKKLDRMATFVDAILAIVITLLVLELHLPELTNHNSSEELLGKLYHLAPHFSAFLLCFLSVMQFWAGSNAFAPLVAKYDNNYGILNVLMMLPFSLMPFAAAILGEYPDNPGSFVFFGMLYLFGTIVSSIHVKYILRNDMLAANVNKKLFEEKIVKLWWVSPIIMLLLIGSAFINTMLSWVLFASMLSLWLYMAKQIKTFINEEAG